MIFHLFVLICLALGSKMFGFGKSLEFRFPFLVKRSFPFDTGAASFCYVNTVFTTSVPFVSSFVTSKTVTFGEFQILCLLDLGALVPELAWSEGCRVLRIQIAIAC